MRNGYSESENINDSVNKKSKSKKKWSKKKKVIVSVIAVLLIIIATLFGIVYSKLSKINIEKLDENDLDVNSDLYNELSGELSKAEFDNVVNIALFGSDSRDVNNASAGRSDCIMIASINQNTKKVSLVSIPRDTYVNVPGYGKTKINHAYAYGGEQLAIKTINNNFDLNITEYVTIDFSGLINIINSVGGIELTISKEEMNVLNQYLTDSYKLTGKTYVPMTKYGKVTLNGEQALAHSRDRYVGNDFDRANRQRTVLMALMNKLASMNTDTLMAFISDDFLSQVKTNINVTKYTGLITSVLKNKSSYLSDIASVQVPSTDYAKGQYIDGVYYFVPDMDSAKKDMLKYLYGVE